MATITSITTPSTITPVYNDIIICTEAVGDTGQTPNYYKIEIMVGGDETRTLRVLPDLNKQLNVNINKILQQFIETKIYINDDEIKEIIPNSIITFSYVVTAYFDTNSAIYNSSTYYCFNGVTNDPFDFNSYLVSANNYGKALNTRQGGYVVKLNEKICLQFFNGTFDGSGSYLNTILVKGYYLNGSTLQTSLALGVNTNTGIASIDVSPSVLSGTTSVVFDDTLIYYTVSSNYIQTQAIYIDKVDPRYDKHFRFAYVSSLGATDFINFNIGYEVNLNQEKEFYEKDNKIKQFNNNIVKKITLVTDYMSSTTSNSLTDLWTSPLITDISGIYYYNAVIDVKEIIVKHRRTEKLISYEIPFTYTDKYKILKI